MGGREGGREGGRGRRGGGFLSHDTVSVREGGREGGAGGGGGEGS